MTRVALTLAGALVALLAAAPVVSAQTVEQLIARNLEAKGGAEQIHAVHSIRQTSVMSSQGMVAELTILSKRPNLMRQELRIGRETQIYGFDGQTPWMINPAATGSREAVPVSGAQAEEIRSQASFDGPLVDYAARGAKVELVGAEDVSGTRMHHLKVTSRQGQVQHIYLDEQTGLESRIVIEGPAGRAEQVLSDYRRVEGLVLPFRITMFTGGAQTAELRVQTVEFNVDLDDALFRSGR